MADNIKISITGMKELADALQEISRDMELKCFRQATREAAKQMGEAVRSEAPVAQTGELAKGPKTRAGKRKKGRILYTSRYARAEATGKFYANPVDRGSTNSGRNKITQKPNPYMERGFQKSAPGLAENMPKIMSEKLDALVEKANRTPK